VDNEDLWIQFNSTLRWVMEKNGRLYPAGQNTQDLGYSGGGELRTGYFGTSLDLVARATRRELVLRNATTSNTTTVQAGAAGSASDVYAANFGRHKRSGAHDKRFWRVVVLDDIIWC
jgi:hypothetical protein